MRHDIDHYRDGNVNDRQGTRWIITGFLGFFGSLITVPLALILKDTSAAFIAGVFVLMFLYGGSSLLLWKTHSWEGLPDYQRRVLTAFYAMPKEYRAGIGFNMTIEQVSSLSPVASEQIINKINTYRNKCDYDAHNVVSPEASVLIDAFDAVLGEDEPRALGYTVSGILTKAEHRQERHDFSGSTTCRKCGGSISVARMSEKSCPVIQEDLVAHKVVHRRRL